MTAEGIFMTTLKAPSARPRPSFSILSARSAAILCTDRAIPGLDELKPPPAAERAAASGPSEPPGLTGLRTTFPGSTHAPRVRPEFQGGAQRRRPGGTHRIRPANHPFGVVDGALCSAFAGALWEPPFTRGCARTGPTALFPARGLLSPGQRYSQTWKRVGRREGLRSGIPC